MCTAADWDGQQFSECVHTDVENKLQCDFVSADHSSAHFQMAFSGKSCA